MAMTANSPLFATVFNELTKMRELRSKWLTDELIVMIIQHMSKTKQVETNINKNMLNGATVKDPKYSSTDNLTAMNDTGVCLCFRNHKTNGKHRRLRACFFCRTKFATISNQLWDNFWP